MIHKTHTMQCLICYTNKSTNRIWIMNNRVLTFAYQQCTGGAVCTPCHCKFYARHSLDRVWLRFVSIILFMAIVLMCEYEHSTVQQKKTELLIEFGKNTAETMGKKRGQKMGQQII